MSRIKDLISMFDVADEKADGEPVRKLDNRLLFDPSPSLGNYIPKSKPMLESSRRFTKFIPPKVIESDLAENQLTGYREDDPGEINLEESEKRDEPLKTAEEVNEGAVWKESNEGPQEKEKRIEPTDEETLRKIMPKEQTSVDLRPTELTEKVSTGTIEEPLKQTQAERLVTKEKEEDPTKETSSKALESVTEPLFSRKQLVESVELPEPVGQLILPKSSHIRKDMGKSGHLFTNLEGLEAPENSILQTQTPYSPSIPCTTKEVKTSQSSKKEVKIPQSSKSSSNEERSESMSSGNEPTAHPSISDVNMSPFIEPKTPVQPRESPFTEDNSENITAPGPLEADPKILSDRSIGEVEETPFKPQRGPSVKRMKPIRGEIQEGYSIFGKLKLLEDSYRMRFTRGHEVTKLKDLKWLSGLRFLNDLLISSSHFITISSYDSNCTTPEAPIRFNFRRLVEENEHTPLVSPPLVNSFPSLTPSSSDNFKSVCTTSSPTTHPFRERLGPPIEFARVGNLSVDEENVKIEKVLKFAEMRQSVTAWTRRKLKIPVIKLNQAKAKGVMTSVDEQGKFMPTRPVPGNPTEDPESYKKYVDKMRKEGTPISPSGFLRYLAHKEVPDYLQKFAAFIDQEFAS